MGGGIAVEAVHLADFRQQFSLDTIKSLSTESRAGQAISIFNGSTGELRGEYKVTGEVRVGLNSTLRLSKRSGPVGEINGRIRVRQDSSVSFNLFTLKDETVFGLVTVNGRLDCSGGSRQGRVGLSGGQVPVVFPDPLDQATSQCRDFNGNVVLPVFFQCNDGIDNDGDGDIDFPADGQCVNEADDNELS